MRRVSPDSSVKFLPLLVLAASAYNVHQAVPSISVNSGGGSDQLFGFSVALHQFSNGSTVNLVGAPMVFVDSSGVTEGGIYVCPTANGSSCYLEPLFNSRQDSFGTSPAGQFLDHVDDPLSHPNADFNGQLLGYTLKSFSYHVMTCAPLFIGLRSNQAAAYTGRCVVFPHDFNALDTPDQISPGMFPSTSMVNDLLMGLGVALMSENTTSSNIALGYGRSGSLPYHGVAHDIYVGDSENVLAENGNPFSDNMLYDDLLGYHVEVGYITSLTSYVAVIGAPRGNNHLGNVFGTDFAQAAHLFALTGDQSDGYFGSSFAVCDWMSGGYHSIVVGCPLCDGDVGRVYAYKHSGDPTSNNMYPSVQQVTPPSTIAGRFGLSVANAGDLDKDGYDDVVIAAPLDGGGVVYIYRGCELGLFTFASPQVIRPAAQTSLFGYRLSTRVDIDNNSYPDLSATDMSGTVYTFRTDPLVVVNASFKGLSPTLNINTDVCTVGSFSAACFNFTLCFGYSPLAGGGDAGTFGINYTLSVDQPQGRVLQISTLPMTALLTLSRSTILCTGQYNFFLKPDSTDTISPIVVQLALQDVPHPIPLPQTPQSILLGGPLTPLLDRYTTGSQPRNLLNSTISLITGCGTSGVCTPNYVLQVKKEGPAKVLISSDPFNVGISIENIANQSGIAPQLFIDVPPGIGIYGGNTNMTTIAGVQSCDPLTITQFKCSLSLIRPMSYLNITIPFILDPNTFGVTLLGQPTLPSVTMNFTVGQNYSLSYVTSILSLALDAQAQYSVTSSTDEAEYAAYSYIAATSSLTGQGPSIQYTVKVTNSLAGGTTIPNSTLYIYWPTYFKSSKGQVPLMVAIQDTSPTASCRHYDTVPKEALRFNVTRPQQYNDSNKPVLPSVYSQSNSFVYGVIVCDIENLAAQVSVDVIILSQLWSTSVLVPLMPSIVAAVSSGSSLPNFSGGNPSDNVTILLSPGVKEFAVACFPIWIIIVAVIGGFVCLGIFGAVFICALMLYRFFRKTNRYSVDMDNPDNDDEFVYRERKIPPIPGLQDNSSRPSSIVTHQYQPVAEAAQRTDPEAVRKEEREMEKEREMEDELRLQAQLTHTMTRLVKQPQAKEASEAPSGDSQYETTL